MTDPAVVRRAASRTNGSRVQAAARRSARASPRAVLLIIVILIAVSAGLYQGAPWILPVRILEGPLVQLAGEDGVSLAWYTTRPATCAVLVTIGNEQRKIPAIAGGRRNLARVSGLAPGSTYSYRIVAGRRTLTGPLAFQTNRADGQRFTFIVFGDSGKATRAQYGLAAEMVRATPAADFIVHTGDLVYGDGARQHYAERFFTPYRHLLSRVDFWPCLGNHDIAGEAGAAPFEEVFELPQNGPPGLPEKHNYWFDYASARFAVIDSDEDEKALGDVAAPWLRGVMTDPRPRWRFVVFHHPPYTVGQYKPAESIRRALVPVFEETGVDLAFSGHDHNYQRTQPLRGGQVAASGQGVIYVVTGAGGASLYALVPPEQRPSSVAAGDDQNHSFTQVTVWGDELRLRQIALGGKVIDECTLQKSPRGSGALGATSAPTTSATSRDAGGSNGAENETP